MPRYEIAHLNEQGNNMIIVPVDPSFGSWGRNDQAAFITMFQIRANNAGLAGRVVPVWESGGVLYSLPPDRWRSFFGSIDAYWVAININRTLSW